MMPAASRVEKAVRITKITIDLSFSDAKTFYSSYKKQALMQIFANECKFSNISMGISTSGGVVSIFE